MLTESTRIFYRGDMANMEDLGTIARAYSDKWGRFYDITLDDGRNILGLPAIMVKTKDTGNGLSRFVTLKAHNEYRREQFASSTFLSKIKYQEIV